VSEVRDAELEGEVVAEEDAAPGEGQEVRPLPQPYESSSPVVRGDVRTAALVAAGGAIAGAATVAAVRAVGSTSRRRSSKRLLRRQPERPANVVASRSFLVDVHLLGR
jgi:hypothetical protein